MTEAPSLTRAGSPDRGRAVDVAHWLRGRLADGAQLAGDSRDVRPGDAFFAFPGARSDGRDFVGQALERGARVVLWQDDERGAGGVAAVLSGRADVASRAVPGLRELSGPIAAEFYERPSERLDLVAVTGTNGKTSTTHWIAQGLQSQGRQAAVIGTLGSGMLDALDPFGLTTPDALRLQRMLAGFVAQGVSMVAAEASSIGLHQGRFDGARIPVAVFTNLTHDHLDYHRTMVDYAAAKAMLFARSDLLAAVVNVDDDAAGRMLAALREPGVETIGYGLAPFEPRPGIARRLFAERIVPRADGVNLKLAGDFGEAQLALAVLGRFNVANALAAAATWLALGLSFEQTVASLQALRPVRGRMQIVEAAGRHPLVVVDYAHTPDALSNVLQTLRPVAEVRGGQLWCVFGAGGDRDPAKRPVMGRIAQTLADRVVVTSDNPRSEAPLAIIGDIRAGFDREPQAIEPDRARAIAQAIGEAAAADVVVIAGKGHEDYQEIDGRRLPFSDVQEAQRAFARRSSGSRHG